MVEHMMKMTAWHQDSFNAWPIGEGYDPVVHEFDFMDYEQNGVKITHWPTSHTKDGATSYRLDWNGRSLCYTGDNRPNSLTIKYCSDVDMLISEVQTATVSMSAQALGMPVALAAYTIDTSHTPAYGLGYICNEAQPKVCVATHYSYDDIFNNETVAEVRHHYKGAFAFGAPDLVTFNIHGDGKVWWREGVAADSSQTPRPALKSPIIKFPAPRHQVYDVINDTIEANEIPPEKWYPEGHMRGQRNPAREVVSGGSHAGADPRMASHQGHRDPQPVCDPTPRVGEAQAAVVRGTSPGERGHRERQHRRAVAIRLRSACALKR
jgi:ribonuclease Z